VKVWHILAITLLFASVLFGSEPRLTKPRTPDEVYQNDIDLQDSMRRMRYFLEYTPSTIGADQNDYDIGNYNILRLTSDAVRTLTGLQGGKAGRWVILVNVGSNNIVLAHQSASSNAANRIISPTAANYTLTASSGSSAFCYYDAVTDRWRVLFGTGN
jgi:hypothetical protein